jgi:hypothetical protein
VAAPGALIPAPPLTARERTIALGLAIAGAAAFLAIGTAAMWQAAGIALVGVMGTGAIRRHRVTSAIAAFVVGLGPWWDGFIVFGAVYLLLAFGLVRAGRQVDHDRRGPRR